MLIPSTWLVVFSIGVITLLAVVDWYVWGTTYASDIRRARDIRPLTIVEMVDQLLGRWIAVNESGVPISALKPANETAAQPYVDHADGFKRVA